LKSRFYFLTRIVGELKGLEVIKINKTDNSPGLNLAACRALVKGLKVGTPFPPLSLSIPCFQ